MPSGRAVGTLLVVSQGTMLAFYLIDDDPGARAVIGVTGGIATVLIASVGLVHGGRDRLVRGLFVGCLAGLVLGDEIARRLTGADGVVPYPALPDVAYLAATVALAVGVGLVAVLGEGERHPGAVLDTVLASSGLIVLSVQFGLVPALASGGLAGVVSGVYAAGDVVCLVAAAWCFFSGRRLTTGVMVVAAAAACWFLTDLVYAIEQSIGVYRSGGLLDLGWYVPNTLLAIACWTGVRGEPQVADTAGARVNQLRAAAVVGLMGPVGLVVSVAMGAEVNNLTLVAVTVVPLMAALWRMLGLVAVLERQAATDAMTGLFSRGAFCERAERALASGGGLTLVFCDLDHFKEINDTHGHAAGDAVLIAIADRLRRHAGSGGFAGRLGGDEFALVLPGGDADVQHRLWQVLSVPVDVAGVSLPVSCSVGVVIVAAGERPDFDDVISEADALMYERKRESHGRRGEIAGSGVTRRDLPRQRRDPAVSAHGVPWFGHEKS